MKGYDTAEGYRGYVPSIGKYLLFDTENEYVTYCREMEGL